MLIINQTNKIQIQIKKKSIYIVKSGAEFFDSEQKQFNYYKIGVSEKPEQRLKQLQTGCPFFIHIVQTIKVEKPFKVEKYLHKKLRKYSANGEWFRVYLIDQHCFFNLISQAVL